MSRTPNSGRRERFRKNLHKLFTPTSVVEPFTTRLPTDTALNSHGAITSHNASSLHVLTSRPSSHTPSPTPGPRERTRGPRASAISSSVSVDSAALCVRTQSQAHAVQASTVLADALEKLDEKERDTVRALLSPSTFRVDDALHEAYNKAKELQARSASKRWSWTYRGRQVYVQDQADKLVRFIDKFTLVGDAAASIDPVHAGLPWAGVRSILELALSDSNLRGAIATGMEVALFASHRLQVYSDMHAQLPVSSASGNFYRALVNLHARVLKFLAQAIDIEPRSTISKIARQSWSSDSIQEFEKECENLCGKAEQEASICDREVGAQWKGRLEDSLKSLKDIHDLTASLSRVHDKLDWAKLTYADNATYDSGLDSELATCLPGTRAELLKDVDEWATDVGGKRIFWLCGKAGTGKSTIARTVARKLDDNGLLGASFFFKRGHADRSHAKLVFPTIARQLADKFHEFARLVAAALDRDSFVRNKQLKPQFDQLLLLPLKDATQLLTPSAGIVLVVDALDECASSDDIKTILLLLSRVEENVSFRLRIFVTSRPELPVKLGFSEISGNLHHDVRLEEAQEGSIARDIQVFYGKEFSKIRDATSLQIDELPAQWPGDENIGLLVEKAVPLFIFAFTLCRYIADDPKRNLNIMLHESPHRSLLGLRGTYLPILNSVVVSEDDGKAQDRILGFKRIVGTIVLLFNPLTAIALASLLSLVIEDVDKVLRRLHSVLNIPLALNGKMDCTSPITLFHLSFRDFLVDSALESENKFWVNAKETHRTLGMHCIRLLESGSLKEDVCGVVAPGTRRSAVAKLKVHSSLPEEVAYACCYWMQHVISSGEQIKDSDVVLRFLQKHMLHWTEALSWLGKMSDVIHNIAALRCVVDLDEGKQLLNLLDDASRFTLRNRSIIDEAPLQIYVSALLFAPSLSILRQTHGDSLRRYFDLMPSVPDRWGAERQKLEGHDDCVSAVAFSPDGKTVASGSDDKTVRLWDVATGEEMQKLEGQSEEVSAIAFSPDGKTVASGSRDKTVRLWDTATGEETLKLQGHEAITCVVFSPDSKTVAFSSCENIIRLWDLAVGKQKYTLEGHENWVNAVIFSCDGTMLASGSIDKTVRLWDMVTGEEKQKLDGHDGWVKAVAFSRDGRTVVSGAWDDTARSWDVATGKERHRLEGNDGEVVSAAFSSNSKTVALASSKDIRLWDAATGEELRTLEGHTETITSVAFSPNSKTVASGSSDTTIRLWDIATDDTSQRLEGHDEEVTLVIFSPDGRIVASVSYDGTIKLWNADTGKERQKLKGHNDWARIVTFSPDGKIIASGSDDKTVRLWDVAIGEERRKLEGHDDCVSAVAFSPDGKTVASGSDDKTVRLWDVATGEERQKHQTSRSVSRIAFSRNGSSLETDVGQLDLGTTLNTYPPPVTEPQSILSLESTWIKYCGEDFLWLPHEYRGVCHDAYGTLLVIGQASGAVSFFSFK